MESVLDQKVRAYKELLDRKDALADETKENNAAIKTAVQEITQMMVDEEKPNTTVDGYTYTLQQKVMYSKKSEEFFAENDIDFFDVLRESGLGDIIVEKVDPRTLQSSARAMAEDEENGGLPEELAACLNIYEELGLLKRKANTKALDRARKTKEGI
ncbi:MAG: hypothetical protein LUG61_01535 [Lachnospiraceae bacterium]|nr:hypothetical protein [Lachnospiraceae bacterium]